MKPVEQIEKALEGMVPAALSQRTTRELEEMIDSLAIQDAEEISRPNRWRSTAAWIAAAAALAIGAFSLWQSNPWNPARHQSGPQAPTIAQGPDNSGIELVSQSNHVGKARETGMLADDDGAMLRVLRYEVVEEEMVRDKRSGLMVRVTEPREETVLIPVTNF